MTLLNTFFFKYVSNAKEVIKDNKDIEKSFKDVEHAADEAGESTKDFGNGFTKAIDGITNAGAAWAAFNVLKSGVFDASNLNTQLQRLAENTTKSAAGIQAQAQAIKAFGSAAEAAGGSSSGAMSYYANYAANLPPSVAPLSPQDLMRAMRQRISGQSNLQKQNFLTRNGVTDLGERYLIATASDAEFEQRIATANKNNPRTAQDLAAATAQTDAKANFNAQKDTGMTQIGTKGLPVFDTLVGLASSNPLTAVATAATLAAGVWKLTGGFLKGTIGRFFGSGLTSEGVIGGGEALAASGGVEGLSVLNPAAAAIVAGGAGIGYAGTNYFSKGIEKMMTKFMTKDLIENPLSSNMKNGQSGMGYLMSQGYSRNQAAGILSNIQHESGGDPNARGDGGHAVGIAQWHEGRVKAIQDATGIDVRTASYQKQMQALVWEMKNGNVGFDDKHFRNIGHSDEAGRYFSTRFERPANGAYQSIMRGKTALAMAGQYSNSFGGSGGSVKIDKIEINTQATDAKGIAGSLKDELYSALGFLAANHDDGIEK